MHSLTHTIKSNQFKLFGSHTIGNLLNCSQVGGRGRVQGRENSKWHMHRWSAWCILLNAWLTSVLTYTEPPAPPNMTSDSAPRVLKDPCCNMLTFYGQTSWLWTRVFHAKEENWLINQTYYSKVETDGDKVAGKTPQKQMIALSDTWRLHFIFLTCVEYGNNNIY